jgi:hypothetical protein
MSELQLSKNFRHRKYRVLIEEKRNEKTWIKKVLEFVCSFKVNNIIYDKC